MRKIHFLILISGLFTFCSCSKHIYINYQTETTNTGRILLKPSKPTERTFVTINDSLIVENKSIKSITINNVPLGNFNLHYTSDNSWYKDKLDVQIPIEMKSGKEITKLVEVPPYSTGYWIYFTGIAIIPPLITSISLLIQ